MQLLQYSGLLEAQAQRLRRDALRLQNAALCGTATTNFLDLMENFYGVDEEEGEAELQDAASMAAFIKANKEERTRDAQSSDMAVAKSSVEAEEVGGTESVASTCSQSSKASVSKIARNKSKYPTKCNINEAQLFFPTSAESLHETGVDCNLIGSRENLPAYRGLYCCMFSGCDYGAQVRGNALSHIRRVHLGAAFGCRYCPGQGWWQARSWSNHMDTSHPDQPKYETLDFPTGPLEAVKVEPELFVEEEHFIIPVPKTADSTTDEPQPKRVKTEAPGLTTEELEKASKEGEVYLLAKSPNPNQPRPKVVAVRYRKPPTTVSTEIPTPQEESSQVEAESTDDPNYIPVTQADEDDEFDDDDLLDKDLEDN